MTSPLQIFDDMLRKVNAERGDTYGHPADNFTNIAIMTGPIEECADPVMAVALAQIVTKVARLIQTPDHLDSILDIAGYARCMAMILDRRQATPETAYSISMAVPEAPRTASEDVPTPERLKIKPYQAPPVPAPPGVVCAQPSAHLDALLNPAGGHL